LELEARLRWLPEARVPVAAALDPERLRAELDAPELLRAEGAFEVLRAEGAFELLRAEEFEPLRAAELLRAEEFELLRAGPELALRRLELAPVAPLSLAAARLRPPVFGEALCFGLVCLATLPPEDLVPGWRPLYGRSSENTSMQH
jgi:hypothetical protein